MSPIRQLLSLAFVTMLLGGIIPDVSFATCYGKDPCNACKNCKYCRHCAKKGGTCDVCKRNAARLLNRRPP